MKLTGQILAKAGMATIAAVLAAWGATLLMQAETEFEILKAAVALGFAGAVFAIREWAKKYDLTVVVKGEKPPEEPII